MEIVCRLLRFVVGIFIATLVLCVAMGVFYRYALGDSLYWATEVPRILLVWIVFIGSVIAYHEKRHIAFTALFEFFGNQIQKVMECLIALVVLVFLGVLLVYGISLVQQTLGVYSEALNIPNGYIYICMPLAAGLMIVSTIQHLYMKLRS